MLISPLPIIHSSNLSSSQPTIRHHQNLKPRHSRQMSRNPPTDTNRFDAVYDACLQRMARLSVASDNNNTDTGQTGLSNEGLSCFANCVLQALLNTPQFAGLYCQKALRPYINVINQRGTRGAMTGCFSAVADFYWSGNYYTVNTRAFLDVFSHEINQEFNGNAEEDAHEFQTLLLDRLGEDLERVLAPVPFEQNYQARASTLSFERITEFADDFVRRQGRFSSSIIKDIFKLNLITITNCPICELARIMFEEHNHLSLDIDQDDNVQTQTTPEMSAAPDEQRSRRGRSPIPTRLKDLRPNSRWNSDNRWGDFENSTERERRPPAPKKSARHDATTKEAALIDSLARRFQSTFTDATCPACGNGAQPSLRSFFLWTLPDVLIIQLKRFQFRDGRTVKDERKILFELDNLDMGPYLHPAKRGKTKGGTLYSLYALVVHDGSAESGHYTARVKNLDRRDGDHWQLFDDRNRHQIDDDAVKRSNAYMLYYCRNGASKAVNNDELKELCKKL